MERTAKQTQKKKTETLEQTWTPLETNDAADEKKSRPCVKKKWNAGTDLNTASPFAADGTPQGWTEPQKKSTGEAETDRLGHCKLPSGWLGIGENFYIFIFLFIF